MSESMAQLKARGDGRPVTQTHALMYGLNTANPAVSFGGSFQPPAGVVAFPTGDGITATVSFYVVVPTDSNINRIKFYIYDRSFARLERVEEANITRAENQILVPVRLTRMAQNLFVRPKFYNSTIDSEYADGSTGTFTALSFQNLNNNFASGRGLEAFINNFLQSADMRSFQGQVRTRNGSQEVLG